METFGCIAETSSDAEWQAIDAFLRYFCELERQALVGLTKSGQASDVQAKIVSKHQEPIRYVESVIISAAMMLSSRVEKAKVNMVGAADRITRLIDKIKKARKSKNQNKRRTVRGLCQRLDEQQRVVERERRIADGKDMPSICIGGKKFAKARHAINPDDTRAVKEWRLENDRKRNGHAFIMGERYSPGGNPYLRISKDGEYLTVIMPKALQDKYGKNVTLSLRGVTAQPRFMTNLQHNLTMVEQQPQTKDQIAKRAAEIKAGITRKPRFTRTGPITIRLRRKVNGEIAVDTTFSVHPVVESRGSFDNGALGVDVNPDKIAVTVVNRDGNLVFSKHFLIDLTLSANQIKHQLGNAAVDIVTIAAKHQVGLTHEVLNFGKKKLNLRYLPAKLANKLSSFAYRKMIETLTAACRRGGIPVRPVSAYRTSILGQANFASPYGLSVDQSAACVIARRALGLRERVRPSVLKRAAEHARKTSDGRFIAGKRSVQKIDSGSISKFLPPRKSTSRDLRLRRDNRCSAIGLAPDGLNSRVAA